MNRYEFEDKISDYLERQGYLKINRKYDLKRIFSRFYEIYNLFI